MTAIVCATNAGEDSRAVHLAAFRRAADTDSTVVFLHMLGGTDYETESERMRVAIKAELQWLLHTLVRLARIRSGVDKAGYEIIIRDGDAASGILDYVSEARPGALVLGVPRHDDRSIFVAGSFDAFVTEVEALGVRVELVATKT